MTLSKVKERISPENVSNLLTFHYDPLIKEFYEMQSRFLSMRYKIHQSIETSNIIISLVKSIHLSILRMRERDLDHNISLNNFFFNLDNLKDKETIAHRIVGIVETTGIPKETVRRKLKKLLKDGFVSSCNSKGYYWDLKSKRKENFILIMKNDISAISRLVCNISKFLNINLTHKMVEEEIESQFSFYFYHFLNCQVNWLRMWQNKIKDVDLIFITMQVLIPTLKYSDRNAISKNKDLNNIYTLIG